MTQPDIEQIRARAEMYDNALLDAEGDGSLVGRYFMIAKSRGSDIKALLAAIDELTAENAKLTEVVDVAAECYNARLDSDMPVPWWRLKDALTKAVQ